MEKIKQLILLFCLFLTACETDNKDGIPSGLEIISSDLSIAATGGSGTIEILSAGTWSATSSKEWCTLIPSGKTLTVKVTENQSISSRTAQIIIKAPEGEKQVPVSQQGAIIALSQPQISLGASGKEKFITIKSNLHWTAGVKDSWCHIHISDDTLHISADPHSGNELRTTQITLNAGVNNKILIVSQRYEGAFILDKWSDTNLGATLPATEENIQGSNYRECRGDFYQWGRNVPFHIGEPFTAVMTDPSITAEMAQNTSDFIGSDIPPFDWLTDGSRTTVIATGNSYTWKDRAGGEPCPEGWHIPLDYEARQIFPNGELEGRYMQLDRLTNTEVLDAAGTVYTCVSVGDGNLKRYAIKKFGTDEAYVLKYEWKEGPNGNGYIKITEIQGDAYTDFHNAAEAEALFTRTDEKAELIFPASGYLYCNTGELNGSSCNYWTASPVNEYTSYFCASNFQLMLDSKYCPRALGCQIRCIKDK